MNPLPLFYQDSPLEPGREVPLDEDNARHIVQVLRMQPGDPLALTNGKGLSATASIAAAGKKKCSVQVREATHHPLPAPALTLAVAFTRHSGRNEWLLEKATELGVRRIVPLLTARSVRERFRPDRWQSILTAAMIQSQQYYLPELGMPVSFTAFLEQEQAPQRLMAHCMPEWPRLALPQAMGPGQDTVFCIGPEGDFTGEELTLAVEQGYRGISLGDTRLRTETAAMAACAYFHLINDPTV